MAGPAANMRSSDAVSSDALILLAVAAHVMHAQTEHCTPGEGIVCAPAGGVHGVVEDGVISYRGIPYAHSPVGLRRWRPPLPMEPW